MSEQEHERPLTRREMRLREQAERGGAESSSGGAPTPAAPTSAAEGHDEERALAESIVDVEINPLHPDGTPRTRREMRELREAAIAELLGEQPEPGDAAASPQSSDTANETVADPDEPSGAPTEALSLEDLPEAGGAGDDSADNDGTDDGADEALDAYADELDAPTEAFTLDDLLDATEPTAPTGDADAVANLFATGSVDVVDPSNEAHGAETEAEPGAAADAANTEAEAAEPVADIDDLVAADLAASAVIGGASEPAADQAGQPAGDQPADEGEELPIVEVALDDAPVVAAEVVDEAAADEEATGQSDTGTDTAGYSFPDIQPPEEWRSVFDDPSRAANITAPGDSGDFDDLISRAVAQEGSTGGSGTSALILPSHPGDTGSLTGPLGATGELFVTGSIELPKSMGETGGHSGIHDSIDFDPFLTGEAPESIASPTESGPMPVSALSAVSARRRPEVPVVAEPTKDRSKMPLILALSGGGLIVVVVGVVVYAATQGLFS